MRFLSLTAVLWLAPLFVFAQDTPEVLPGTQPLKLDKTLDLVIVEGVDRYCLNQIELARGHRESHWARDFSSADAYEKSITPNRDRFRVNIGAVDSRVTGAKFERTSKLGDLAKDGLFKQSSPNSTPTSSYTVEVVKWAVLPGVTAEGLALIPSSQAVKGYLIAVPDARWSADQFTGAAGQGEPASRMPQIFVENGFLVIVPTVISRDDDFSGTPDVAMTTQSHREWVYRSAFEMGRHVIGYEVQKVLAAVDLLSDMNVQAGAKLPIGVAGIGDGGLIALYSAAIDNRIHAALVSGYFQPREKVWQEPIDRNVWKLLTEFGDAEIAGMIAPRSLTIEACAVPETDGPPPNKPGRRGGAAPGQIKSAELAAVKSEFDRAKPIYEKLKSGNRISLVVSGPDGRGPAGCEAALKAFLEGMGCQNPVAKMQMPPVLLPEPFDRMAVQKRQVTEAVEFTQQLLRRSYKTRDQLFAQADRSSLDKYVATSEKLREYVYETLIGKLPDAKLPLNPRSRLVLNEKEYTGYEVVLDLYPDIVAGGILLLPKGMKPDEKRPVVVCQHGLEGVPMDTISGPGSEGYKYYKSFAAELAKRGFITYAPQNLYRGRDAFRTLQRKSNPLGRSLFSYIIPQHEATLKWLATLPNVDSSRLAFYGLSYGGKTAVRVPPMLPSREGQPGYCLSICSADYNEWVMKNASTEMPFTYIYTPEYEIFEWNMGHVANYAELSMLMTPRPFMVERGHDDGVGIDEWVAWEYAKVRRHYNKLGIGDRTEIEFFNGPHEIHGQGTYAFLHRHLKWPPPVTAPGVSPP